MKHICRNCKWRVNGNCENEGKIHEDNYNKISNLNDDHLIYSYYESGSFQVGENFGCIHWTKKAQTIDNRIKEKEKIVNDWIDVQSKYLTV